MGRRIYHGRWDVQDGKWREVAGNEMDEMGKRIYHMTWDFQDEKWQVMRWEDEFTRRWDVQDGKWQVMRWMRWENEFTT